MKKYILILGWVITTPAATTLPTIGYISEYLETQCHNPDLVVPGAGRTELTSHQYLLEIIDELNHNNIGFRTGLPASTTYANNISTTAIISTGYLNDSLQMLAESMECCLGGEINPTNGKCEYCDIWAMGADAKCPTNYNKQALTNITVVSDTESCPAGTEKYYHIPDHCMGNTYIYSDGSNNYDNNIGLCFWKMGAWPGAGATYGGNSGDLIIMGDKQGCDSTTATCSKTYALGQARMEIGSAGTRYCYCRMTHLVGPNGFMAPFNGSWMFLSKLYHTNCAFQCAFYGGANTHISKVLFGGRENEN